MADHRRLLIGADPEVFTRNVRTGQFFAAYDMPGNKAKPRPTQFGGMQVDGCALEFNILPAADKKEFLRNLHTTFADLKRELQAKHPEAEIAVVPMAEFNQSYFKRLPKEVKILGCDPDFNAYTLTENKMPKIMSKPVRSAGGHVHIGWTEKMDPFNLEHMYECAAVTRQLDATLFIGSLMFDKNHERRELYGKPGAFRPKEYGVEYRVLSNSWIGRLDLSEWVYDTTMRALTWINEERIISEDDYIKDVLAAARKKPNVFYADTREQMNAYKYLVGLGMPEVPDYFTKVVNAA
jgi:hypothetical protein